MHLPRQQISQLYTHLIRSTHSSSAPILVLTSLAVDSICATRIFTSLLKRDFIPHTIIPVSGYAELQRVGSDMVLPLTRQRGGDGGTVVCLGLGGPITMEEILGLDGQDEISGSVDASMENHGVEVWVIDAHRPWRLDNVFGISAALPQDAPGNGTDFGMKEGKILPSYKPGRGGVIVWDDGDVESELRVEKEAYFALQGMPDITEDDMLHDDEPDDQDENEDTGADDDRPSSADLKRKRGSDDDDLAAQSDSEDDEERSVRRRRSNSNSSIPILSSPGGNPLSAQLDASSTSAMLPSSPPKPTSARQMRKELLRLRRKHEATLMKYYAAGASVAEPVSSMLYSLASELGREDNELLWLAIVGISSASAAPTGTASKINQIREVLQDEVRRLNPIPDAELQRSQSAEATIPTTARSPTDTSIRLSPEPRFLLIRHWSLYDSMLHSPYLATRLHVWSDSGRKRLHKLLAKMGISLQEAGKGYLHMDSEIKRTLRKRILKFAEQYNLDGLVPSDNGYAGMADWGFVRSWGWRGTLSAEDVSVVVGAILEVGTDTILFQDSSRTNSRSTTSYSARMRNLPTPPHSSDDGLDGDAANMSPPDYVTQRFFKAYDSLAPSSGLNTVLQNIPTAQSLYRAILRVGSAIISKKQVRHLHSFRMAVVKEGPDVPLFTHPGALARLAAWIAEAFTVIESEKGHRPGRSGRDAWVLAALDEGRSTYVVIGLGGHGGWNGNGKRMRSKAEIKEREAKKKRKAEARAAAQTEKARKREERRRLRKERNAANGIFDSDDDASDSETETASSSSSGSDSDADSDEDGVLPSKRKRYALNRFGVAFQETVEETGASVRVDSFEHSVVEVGKEDFGQFLNALSMKSVVG